MHLLLSFSVRDSNDLTFLDAVSPLLRAFISGLLLIAIFYHSILPDHSFHHYILLFFALFILRKFFVFLFLYSVTASLFFLTDFFSILSSLGYLSPDSNLLLNSCSPSSLMLSSTNITNIIHFIYSADFFI